MRAKNYGIGLSLEHELISNKGETTHTLSLRANQDFVSGGITAANGDFVTFPSDREELWKMYLAMKEFFEHDADMYPQN